MNLFNIFKPKYKKEDYKAIELYKKLTSPGYQVIYRYDDIGEGMSIAEEVICQY